MFYSSFLLFVCLFPILFCNAMLNLTLWAMRVVVPHRVSSEVSFETVSSYRWLQFSLVMLIFELITTIAVKDTLDEEGNPVAKNKDRLQFAS